MSFAAYLLYLILTYLRPVEMFAPDLAAFRPMMILWLVAFLSAVARAIERREVASRPANFVLLALLMAVIGLSQVANGWAGGALASIADFSTSAMLFVLTALNLTTIERVRTTGIVLLMCMVVLAIYAISAYHYGFMADLLLLRQGSELVGTEVDPPRTPFEDVEGLYFWRARGLGFLNDPNDFGQAIVMVLPFLWGLYEQRRTFRFVLLASLPASALLYAIFLTHSRGALLGFVALFVFAAHKMLGTVRLIGLALVAAVVISGLVVGERGFTTKEESAAQRVEAWWAGIVMLKNKPVLGVGHGNFLDHHELTAHNSFVLAFAELGLLGYFLWIGLLVIAYKGLSQVVRLAPPDSREHKQATLLRDSFIGFMACAWFLSRTYQPGLYLLLALCASATWCAGQRFSTIDESPLQRWQPSHWVGATLATMLFSVLAVYAVILFNQHMSG